MSSAVLPRKVIINGDDLGMSAEVNAAILLAFDQKLISSASLMTNMPGFEEACMEIAQRGLNGSIGVHVNLVEGKPLTEKILECERFCGSDGEFKRDTIRKAFRLSPQESTAVLEEIQQQVQLCIDRGIHPTHLDSHHHFHTSWPIGAAVIKVARDKHVPAVRRNGMYQANKGLLNKVLRTMHNIRLNFANLCATEESCSLYTATEALQRGKGVVELVVHPRFDSSHNLIDLELKADLKTLIDSLSAYEKVPYSH